STTSKMVCPRLAVAGWAGRPIRRRSYRIKYVRRQRGAAQRAVAWRGSGASLPLVSVYDKPPGPRRILAIDGGGMRGALAVGILAKLEKTLREKLGRPDLVLSDYFDL